MFSTVDDVSLFLSISTSSIPENKSIALIILYNRTIFSTIKDNDLSNFVKTYDTIERKIIIEIYIYILNIVKLKEILERENLNHVEKMMYIKILKMKIYEYR